MIYVVFFSGVFACLRCKILFSYRFANFSDISIVSNYLCDRYSYLISTLGFQRYSPCVLTQHLDNSENIAITFVESCIKAHLDHISLPYVIVSGNYDTSAWKIFSRQSVQFFHYSSLFEVFLLRHVTLCDGYCCIMRKILQKSDVVGIAMSIK